MRKSPLEILYAFDIPERDDFTDVDWDDWQTHWCIREQLFCEWQGWTR